MTESIMRRTGAKLRAALLACAIAVLCCCAAPALAQAAQLNIDEEAYIYFEDGYYSAAPVTPAHEAYYYDDYMSKHSLTEGKDYRVVYSNNVNLGTATATVYGMGSFTGTTVKNFTIYARSLYNEAVTADPINGLVYTGAAHLPKPTLKIGSYTLREGVDYRIMSYSGNVDAGSGYVSCEGMGNFNGSTDVDFSIARANINNATFAAIPTQTYTSYTIEPDIKGTFNGTELGYGDYTSTFTNNRAVGTATITLTGNYNFEGQRTLTFKIAKGANSLKAKAAKKTITLKRKYVKRSSYEFYNSDLFNIEDYDGDLSYKKSSAKASGKAKKYAKKIKVSKKYGTLTMPKGAAKGTYTVKVKITAKDTIKKNASKTITLKIKVK